MPQLLIVGLSGAGKTTLLYKLKVPGWEHIEEDMKVMRDFANMDEADERKNKDGETLAEDGPKFDAGYHYEEGSKVFGTYGMWDVAGTQAMRHTWRSFYHSIRMHAVIFVVDGSEEDMENIHSAKKLLHFLMNEDELRLSAFVVVINQHRWEEKSITRDQEKHTEEHQHELEETLPYKLGFHDLHRSCKWRTLCVPMNVLQLTGESDLKWRTVLDHIKAVIMDPRGMAIKHI